MPSSPSQPPRSRSRRFATAGNAPDGGRWPKSGLGCLGNPLDCCAGHLRRRPIAAGLTPPGRLCGPHPFTSRRFHGLLNSLFKVLFNFPSRYLSTIGLVPVFSLRWSLPPALGCIPKQPDSGKTAPRRGRGRYRPHTVPGLSLDQKDSGPCAPTPGKRSSVRHTSRARLGGRGFGAGLLPLRSPLLGESWLVSFPPLTDMLKFSGSSRLI